MTSQVPVFFCAHTAITRVLITHQSHQHQSHQQKVRKDVAELGARLELNAEHQTEALHSMVGSLKEHVQVELVCNYIECYSRELE